MVQVWIVRLGCFRGPGQSRLKARALKMSRVPSLSSPFLIGFDQIERALDRVAKAADGYPPYNIERLAADANDPERLRITLAIAGFTLDQLEVTVEEKELVIRGRQQEDKSRQYLHRGIAARQFQRAFVLAEGIEVEGAWLDNGLLHVDLRRPQPEVRVRTIQINGRQANGSSPQAAHVGGVSGFGNGSRAGSDGNGVPLPVVEGRASRE
jgi:HSP20 family molecular chaperone IbpA